MSWLEAREYVLLERANGIRFPPSTATGRLMCPTGGVVVLRSDCVATVVSQDSTLYLTRRCTYR